MRRRDFNALLGGGLAWPLGGCGQGTAMPVIGFLNSASPEPFKDLVAAFRQGLKEQGYEDGRNLSIEFRWAEGDENRLKAMASDLVSRRVALIAATGGIRSAEMARDATRTIPVLFISGSNPVERGLVDSINRPGGNATGVSSDTTEMVPKRLEQLQQLVPSGTRIAILVSPGTISRGKGSTVPESETRFAAERGLLVIRVHNTPDVDKELTDRFDDAVNNGGARALLISGDPFYYNRRFLLAELAARYALPAVYPGRDYAVAGGLMSYAPSFQDAYRQIGIYAGRILHGARPGDLPVVSPQKWDLVINLKTANALRLTIPPWFKVRANEIIE
jgi:putative tryptophan/tyrosine transport system substrate-binding protein